MFKEAEHIYVDKATGNVIAEKVLDNNYKMVLELKNNDGEFNIISYYNKNRTPLEGSSTRTPAKPYPNSDLSTKTKQPGDRTSETESEYVSSIPQDTVNVNAKNSSFAKNTSTNEAFSEETRQALKNNPIEYQATTNEERLARANEILSSKSLSEVDSYLRDNWENKKIKDIDSADTVLAGE